MIDNRHIRTNDLLRLARDRSAESRFVLATSINDVYAEREGHLSRREKALIDDILGRLVREFEMDLRCELARRLAPRPRVPRSLILMLANDRIEVARPVLLESEVLRTPDLVAIIKHHGEAHQRAIAERRALDPEVSAALAASGNVAVIEALLRNHEAGIAEPTLAHLVEEAKWIETYREPLAYRPDLPPELAGRLYRLVSAVLRQHILANFDIDPADFEEALQESLHERSPPGGAAREEKSEPSLPVPSIYGRMAEREEITPELLIRILRRGEMSLFRSLFGQWTQLGPRRLDRVLREPSGKALAVVCRALGMAKSDFAIILFLTRQARPSGVVDDPRDIARLMDFYERIVFADARRRLQRWRDGQPEGEGLDEGPGDGRD